MTVTITPIYAPPDDCHTPTPPRTPARRAQPQLGRARYLSVASLIVFFVLGRLSHIAWLRHEAHAAAAFNIASLAWFGLAAVALACAVRALRATPRDRAAIATAGFALLPLVLLVVGLAGTA